MIPLLSSIRQRLFNLYHSLEIKEHQLLYLFCEITRSCNLRCRHCGSDCIESSGPVLTTDSWVKIIDFISKSFSPSPALIFTGGEPLVHKELDSIIRAAAERNMRWGMVTNGFCLDTNKMKKLLDNKITSMTISLDGCEERHNWLRGNELSFSNAVKAIRLAVESNLTHMDVVTCVYPGNFDGLERLAELLLHMRVKSWRLFRIFPAGRATEDRDLLLSFHETQRLLTWVKQNRPSLQKRGLQVSIGCEGWLPYDIDRKVRNPLSFCRAGINIASIRADGTITGCTNNDPQFDEGNILTDNFVSVWQTRFSNFRDRPWLKKSTCSTCNYVNKCKGGSIHLWRDDFTKPIFCYCSESRSKAYL